MNSCRIGGFVCPLLDKRSLRLNRTFRTAYLSEVCRFNYGPTHRRGACCEFQMQTYCFGPWRSAQFPQVAQQMRTGCADLFDYIKVTPKAIAKAKKKYEWVNAYAFSLASLMTYIPTHKKNNRVSTGQERFKAIGLKYCRENQKTEFSGCSPEGRLGGRGLSGHPSIPNITYCIIIKRWCSSFAARRESCYRQRAPSKTLSSCGIGSILMRM